MKVKVIINALLLLQCLFIFTNATNMISSQIEVDKDTFTDDNKIQGKMTINGQIYTAICDCNQVSPDGIQSPSLFDSTTKPSCDPSKLKMHQEREGSGASFNDIRKLIGNIEELNYVKVPNNSFKCLDGRHIKPGLNVPGGDAGEFILALSVYEDLIGGGRQLTQDNIDVFLTEYLKKMLHNIFYMCTDDVAISHIEKELQIEGLNLVNPRVQIRDELIPLLVKPENIGDLHIRMMIKHPDQFSIRKEIVEMFIKSYYKIMWDKSNDLSKKLFLDILSGEHNESAFVEVRSENVTFDYYHYNN